MLKRIGEVTGRIHDVCNDLFTLMPKQYRLDSVPGCAKPSPSDPVCEAWRNAMGYMAAGHDTLKELSKLLAVKAGIELIEIDGDAMTLDEWAVLYDKSPELILERVKRGWDWELAVTNPAAADEMQPAE